MPLSAARALGAWSLLRAGWTADRIVRTETPSGVVVATQEGIFANLLTRLEAIGLSHLTRGGPFGYLADLLAASLGLLSRIREGVIAIAARGECSDGEGGEGHESCDRVHDAPVRVGGGWINRILTFFRRQLACPRGPAHALCPRARLRGVWSRWR